MVVIARVLTVFLAAVPASVLCVWALLGFIAGTAAMFAGEWIGAVLIVWGLSGIYGTIALWAVGFGCDEPSCVWGLAIGIAAILPLAIHADPLRSFQTGELDLSTAACIAPLCVGVAWLLAFLVRRKLFAFEGARR